jgi:tRNA pseudouridine38-40 synthase
LRRLRLVLEYDGTGFHGFQRQPGARTVQETLEECLEQLCGHPVEVTGAGRTDAGVHALGQVVHLDTGGAIPAGRVARAANALLGEELRIRAVEETEGEFHARFTAARRTYHYYFCRERPSPFLARYVLHTEGLPEAAGERIRSALPALRGTHDFGAFAVGGTERPSSIRTVSAAALEEQGALLRLEVSADGFLRSMVRRIVGLLLEIGRGRREPEAVAAALRTGHMSAPTAPPHGLFLARVEYPDGYPPPGRGAPEFWNVRSFGE